MIVPIKKIELYGLLPDRDAVLRALQREAVMMVVSTPDSEKKSGAAEDDESLQSSEEALMLAKKYKKTSSFFEDRTVVSFDELEELGKKGENAVQSAVRTAQEMESARRELASLENLSSQLEPWQGLSMTHAQLAGTKYAKFVTGYINADAIPDLLEREVAVKTLGTTQQGTAVLVAFHKNNEDSVREYLKGCAFTESEPPSGDETPETRLKETNDKCAELKKRIGELETQAQNAADDIKTLELKRDADATNAALKKTPSGTTASTFYLSGYAEADKLEILENAVKSVTNDYELVASDPEPDEIPPTKTRNNKFVEQFETITDMFSRPDPRGVDPNPVMGPWYWIIFGMMMADVGYGAVMALLLGGFLLVKKPHGEFGKLVKVLLFCSVTTVFWGVMFGSYFGAEWFPPVILTPLDDPLLLMIICLVVGVLHIFSGMALKMYDLIRHGDVKSALFDQLSWMFLLTGLGLLAVPALKILSYTLIALGAGTILLTAGRDKKGIIGKAAGGLMGLYNITSYFSDILSYARILALMLSSGVVAFVMNLLAGMVRGDPPTFYGIILSVVVYIIGHAFNLAMGLLSAYVHASRLQYIEFFGKFYDGGGYEFKPLAPETKYVEVAKKNKQSAQ